MKPANLLVVCGPTASGKTSLAVSIARKFRGEIISADSRQIYRGLDIGSGKDLNEYTVNGQTVPFHLIDTTDPAETYTVSRFKKDFNRIFPAVISHKMLPILCGGTGLYIEAVLRNFQIPEVPENRELRARLATVATDELKKRLYTLDPEQYSRTDLSSKKRIIRGIEVASHSKTDTEKPPETTATMLSPAILCTRWERTILHRRITERLYQRINEGMIAEVYHLRKNGLADERLIMMGMEYRYITRYLRREISLSAMIATLRTEIYRLAKRQESYFRGMERRCGIPFHWVDNADCVTAMQIVGNFFSIG